jgi:hypothetical protein
MRPLPIWAAHGIPYAAVPGFFGTRRVHARRPSVRAQAAVPAAFIPERHRGAQGAEMACAGAAGALLTLAPPAEQVIGAAWADNAGGIEGVPRGTLESPLEYASDGYGHGDRA